MLLLVGKKFSCQLGCHNTRRDCCLGDLRFFGPGTEVALEAEKQELTGKFHRFGKASKPMH